MAVHGKNANFKLANTAAVLQDLSAKLNSVDFPEEADTHETTGFGSNSRSYVAGLKDSTISFEGFWDAAIDAHLGAALGYGELAFEYCPEGASAGKIIYSGVAILTSFQKGSQVGDVIPFSAELQVSGDVTRSTVA